jgi:hypothetical protein
MTRQPARSLCPGPGTLRSRPGLALPAAIFTLSVIVLFIAGSAFTAGQEARASAGSLAERAALEAAEYGATAVLRDWDRSWNVATPIGRTIGPVIHTLAGGASASVRLTRTSLTTWWVVSEGAAGGSQARRTARRSVNATFRLDLPPDAVDAALGVTDSARVTGSGLVVGTDSVMTAPACALTPADVAGVAAADTMRVCDGACGAAGARIIGLPPLSHDSTVSSRIATLSSQLVAGITVAGGAIVTPGPVVNGGVCDTLSLANWGDPGGNGGCASYFPVIRALGDLTVRGGTGQGIIVAAGDVTFEQGAHFSGLVVAQDDFVTGGGGGIVIGAVLAADGRRGPGDYSTVGDGGLVHRSSCRIRQARLAAAPPVRIRERWWAEFE